MPPQGFAALPFRTDTLLSTLIAEAVGLIRMPDMQLVVTVTFWIQPRLLPTNSTPSPWNCRMTPGPRTPTCVWLAE